MFIRLAYDTLCSTTESCNVCIIVSALCWSSGSAVHMYSKQCTCSMQYSAPAVQLYSLQCIQNALMYFVRWWYIHICALLDVPPFRRILHYTIPRQVGTSRTPLFSMPKLMWKQLVCICHEVFLVMGMFMLDFLDVVTLIMFLFLQIKNKFDSSGHLLPWHARQKVFTRNVGFREIFQRQSHFD